MARRSMDMVIVRAGGPRQRAGIVANPPQLLLIACRLVRCRPLFELPFAVVVQLPPERRGTRQGSGGGADDQELQGMKADIHPKYETVTATCSCGNTIQTRSTRCEDFHIDVCSMCHPFYTGKQKIVDSGGRVDRFNKRFGARGSKR